MVVFDIQAVSFIDDICREELTSALIELKRHNFVPILVNRKRVYNKLGEEIKTHGVAVIKGDQFVGMLSSQPVATN